MLRGFLTGRSKPNEARRGTANPAFFMRLFFLLLFISAQAQITLTTENDFYAPKNKDRNYSNGAQITYSTEGVDWKVIHNLYTPQDIEQKELIENDRPYAALLALSRDRIVDDGVNRRLFGITAGVIGPSACGEEVQTQVHKVVGTRTPLGWDNQLSDEPVLNFRYEQDKYLSSEYFVIGRGYRLDAGNLLTAASFHIPFRFGYNAGQYREKRVIIEGLGHKDWSFGVEADFAVKFIGRDLTLDGNTFRDSHSVEKENVYGEASYGFFAQKNDFSIGVKQVARTEQFEEQQGAQMFGIISVGF